MEPAFGSWPLRSIASWDVEAWVADLARRGVGAEAAASAFRLLKQLLADATRHKLISANPADVVATPQAPKHVDRFLPLEEADALLASITRVDRTARVPRDHAQPHVPDPVNRLFVQLMLDAALRWEEAAGMHVFRVDLMRRMVRVQEVLERDGTIKAIPKSKAGSGW